MNRLLILLLLLVSACQPESGPALVATDPWIRQAPPGMSMTAGFFQLKNQSRQPQVLLEARSDAYGLVEFHTTEITDGVARMRELQNLTIEPGEAVAFEPGARHLMLMRPTRKLSAGDQVKIELVLGGGDVIPVTFVVKSR